MSIFSREPDFIIGDPGDPYMKRWWVIPRNKWFNIYYHEILKSDTDEALHDHPWWNMSIVLQEGYLEVTKSGEKWRSPGSIVFRHPEIPHRLVIKRPAKSIFITGPVVREWGFHCPNGWKLWKDFVDLRDNGSVIGKGCGE